MPELPEVEIVRQSLDKKIRGQIPEKVVLARELVLSAEKGFQISSILERLSIQNKSSMIFNIDGFLGASPELLIKRNGNSEVKISSKNCQSLSNFEDKYSNQNLILLTINPNTIISY